MKTSDFDYYLPPELIAQTPLEKRDNSRLLVYNKNTQKITHDVFYNIGNYIESGDVIVINNTRVIPARLYGTNINGGSIEFLLLKKLDGGLWQTLVKPGKKARTGSVITFSERLNAVVTGYGKEGLRVVKFNCRGNFEEELERIGQTPLPHYIKQKLDDGERYQTVYSEKKGSAAAPTAGLHFTPKLLQDLSNKGVNIAKVLLHVGLDTFRPVKSENLENHKMHSEYIEVGESAASVINGAKQRGKRVIAVGTTSVRVLESAADDNGFIKPCAQNTDIFIYPGYKFKCVDALITNFHLPRSTLIMLVSAFICRENTLNIYQEAIKEKYRFYSFGDAMLIVG